MRQSRNYSFVQKLNVNETNKITIVTQKAIASEIVDVVVNFKSRFKNQSRTNLKNLYDFFVYKKYDLTKIKEIVIVAQMIIKYEIVVVNSKSRSKIKFNKFFKFFKSEEFAIDFNFNSISINSTSMKRFIQSKNYETFLINYKNRSHDKLSSIDIIAIEFYYQSCIKNVIIYSKCDIILID